MIKAKMSNCPIAAKVAHKKIDVDNSNVKVVKGDKGAVFTPHVDEQCNLSWSNDGGLANPPTVNIKGDNGDATVTPMTNLEIEAIMGR